MSHLIKRIGAVSPENLRELLGIEPDEPMPAVIETHSGEWRREGEVYVAWDDPECFE
jgi:hypothetical protein